MTIFERLELIRAGYKRAEIDAMIQAEAETKKEPEEPKEPVIEPEEPKEPVIEPDNHEVTALKERIAELEHALQMQNIQKLGIDTMPAESVENVLAQAVFGNPK